jgi:hypothetical protein
VSPELVALGPQRNRAPRVPTPASIASNLHNRLSHSRLNLTRWLPPVFFFFFFFFWSHRSQNAPLLGRCRECHRGTQPSEKSWIESARCLNMQQPSARTLAVHSFDDDASAPVPDAFPAGWRAVLPLQDSSFAPWHWPSPCSAQASISRSRVVCRLEHGIFWHRQHLVSPSIHRGPGFKLHRTHWTPFASSTVISLPDPGPSPRSASSRTARECTESSSFVRILSLNQRGQCLRCQTRKRIPPLTLPIIAFVSADRCHSHEKY